MKADIVNPGAAPADRYSRWDELVAIHRMIQNANAPGATSVNFGHGGTGAFSFLSWHRYFLYFVEQRLQSYVPGVMIPYWDWTDPAPIMIDTFLGPDGDAGTTQVTRGYFAGNAPATGGNPTPSPAWWPAGLPGWRLHTAFGGLAGALRRDLSGASGLPSVSDIRTTLAQPSYASFQDMLESGNGLPFHEMHNGLHGWVSGHMGSLTGSPFDPIFYLHHCNIDRLWAMWQVDGHADVYPTTGGNSQHHRDDIMYPWTGGAAGYSSNTSFAPIVMPDFSALGAKRNVDTLDHRTAFGYTYDTLAVIGIGLDRTGSMNGLTPDPMTGAGNVTKWEAARRGVSAFLQDCETVQDSGVIYITAGVKTFRSQPANDFESVFPGTPYGLVKSGTAYSKGTFDSTAAGMTAAGGTPLADALQNVEDTLVEPPFGWVPADEQRYLAMLTDGMLTTGSPMSSIPDGGFAGTAVFAMGFGTAADVDYATLDSMVAKGRSLGFTQVFHGENAGTIDKFFSNALARAIGFSTVFDPVLELFAGEHAHLDFTATSAEESFLVTAQGMDFEDPSWSFHLTGPDGTSVYSDGPIHAHVHAAGHGRRLPHVTAKRGAGRLSLVLQRDSAPTECWVGSWRLMVAYRAKDLTSMVMPDIGELIFPVAAGPIRGPRFARLLQPVEKRIAARSVVGKQRHALDVRPGATSREGQHPCSIVVNIYARTRLRIELEAEKGLRVAGDGEGIAVATDTLAGNAVVTRSFARLVAPTVDLRALVKGAKRSDIPKAAYLKGSRSLKVDPARVLAALERRTRQLARMRDESIDVVQHGSGAPHMHLETATAGLHNVGVFVEGTYCPEHGPGEGHDHQGAVAHHDHGSSGGCGPDCSLERFTRILSTSFAAVTSKPRVSARRSASRKSASRGATRKKTERSKPRSTSRGRKRPRRGRG